MPAQKDYNEIYAKLEQRGSETFNELNGYNELNGIDDTMIRDINNTKRRYVSNPYKLEYELNRVNDINDLRKTIRENQELSKDVGLNMPKDDHEGFFSTKDLKEAKVNTFENYMNFHGINLLKLETLHRILHASLGDKYVGINNHYNIDTLNKFIKNWNENIYENFYEGNEDKYVRLKNQVKCMSKILYEMSSTLNKENMFSFGNINTALLMVSMSGACNKEIIPLRFGEIPPSLLVSNLKSIVERDLIPQIDYKKHKYDKSYIHEEIDEEKIFNSAQKIKDEYIDQTKNTIMTYLSTSLPEQKLDFIPHKNFIEYFNSADKLIDTAQEITNKEAYKKIELLIKEYKIMKEYENAKQERTIIFDPFDPSNIK